MKQTRNGSNVVWRVWKKKQEEDTSICRRCNGVVANGGYQGIFDKLPWPTVKTTKDMEMRMATRGLVERKEREREKN